jgi:DNA-dependent metalloprotease WSS1
VKQVNNSSLCPSPDSHIVRPLGIKMSQTHPTELDPLVSSFQHDAHRPHANQALLALRKIASLVKPIMRRRNWSVGTLCEFYPEERNLLGLNINRNEKICLRLRYPSDERQFLPIEEVVDTMLHELCHYVHGPHNEQFHALWNQIRDEHESLVRKGYTGEGFLSAGNRLGGERIPLHEARRRARAAAEKRNVLSAGSGQKLGGMAVSRGADIRKVIADAAQRRIDIMKGCASGTDRGRQIARDVEAKKQGTQTTKAEEEDENERIMMQAYIELIQEEEQKTYGEGYVPPSASNPAGNRSAGAPAPAPAPWELLEAQRNIEKGISRTATPTNGNWTPPPLPTHSKPRPTPSLLPPRAKPVPPPTIPSREPETWTCDICTLVNPLNYLTCDACGTDRPSSFTIPPDSQGPHQQPNGTRNGVFAPRLNVADSYVRIRAQEAAKLETRPMGWSCGHCGNWMEDMWWTCASCGRMKESS